MSAQIKAPHGRDTDAGLKKRHSDSDYNPARDFADTRIIPCRPGDPRISFGFSEDEVCASQWCDGPTYLVIGHHAPEAAIERGCLRFNMDRAKIMTALASDAEGQV